MRVHRGIRSGFTILEMLVAIAVISILVGIVLAVGRQVLNASRTELTRAELKSLLGAEQSVVHETAGVVPDSMYSFLVEYQRMHAFQDANGVWRLHTNMLTSLPPSMVKTSTAAMPNNGSMLMITQVNDAWGNPIQFLPTIFYNSHAPCFISAGQDGIIGNRDDLHSYDPP